MSLWVVCCTWAGGAGTALLGWREGARRTSVDCRDMQGSTDRTTAKVFIAPDEEWVNGADLTEVLGLSGYCEQSDGAMEFSPRFMHVAEAVEWGRQRASSVVLRINNHGEWGRTHYWAGDGAAPSDVPTLDMEAAEAELAWTMNRRFPPTG